MMVNLKLSHKTLMDKIYSDLLVPITQDRNVEKEHQPQLLHLLEYEFLLNMLILHIFLRQL
jgi:hypothetical protein